MRVFIAGATGVLGRRLVELLGDRGHEVVGLARDDDGAALIEARGGTARRGDVLEPDTLAPAMRGADVVVNAATALPVETKPTDEDWARNDRVRVGGTRNLAAAAADGVERFLFPSIVWVARQPDGSPFDEGADRHPDRATRSAADVEDYLRDAASEHGFGVTILRCGFFYAPDAGHTRQLGQQLLSGKLPIVGGGPFGRRDAKLSLLHADDAARAFVAAIEADATGLYHVVDDRPVTVANFFSTFAAALDAPEPRRIPGWLARFFVGKETVNVLTNSFPTTSERFRRDVGWEPIHSSYRDGITRIVETWEEDGTIRETPTGYEWTGDEPVRSSRVVGNSP